MEVTLLSVGVRVEIDRPRGRKIQAEVTAYEPLPQAGPKSVWAQVPEEGFKQIAQALPDGCLEGDTILLPASGNLVIAAQLLREMLAQKQGISLVDGDHYKFRVDTRSLSIEDIKRGARRIAIIRYDGLNPGNISAYCDQIREIEIAKKADPIRGAAGIQVILTAKAGRESQLMKSYKTLAGLFLP